MTLSPDYLYAMEAGKQWEYIETVSFIGTGVAVLRLAGWENHLIISTGYCALSFLIGKGTYFATKYAIQLATPYQHRPSKVYIDRIVSATIGIAMSALGALWLLSQPWNMFLRPLSLTIITYVPAVSLRSLLLHASNTNRKK